MTAFPEGSARQIRAEIGLQKLRETLGDVAPHLNKDLEPSDNLASVLPVEDRRLIWMELQAAGFDLPELQRSHTVVWISLVMVAAPLILLCLALRTWSIALSIVELGYFAYKWTRPFAVHPPNCCSTVAQAIRRLGSVRLPDGGPLPWSHEEVVEAVREAFAGWSGVPIKQITPETRIVDLFGD